MTAGTVVWNTDKKCLDVFNGTTWQCTDGSNANTHGTQWVSAYANAPWNRFSSGVLSSSGYSFVEYDGTGTLSNSNVGYYAYGYRNQQDFITGTRTIDGIKYRLPSRAEWNTIFPEKSGTNTEVKTYVSFETNSENLNIAETNSLGNFISDFKKLATSKTVYALRFKGNNDLISAWKYESISRKGIRVTVVSLGKIGATNKTINDISTDAFWNGVSSSDKKTIFFPYYGLDSSTDNFISPNVSFYLTSNVDNDAVWGLGSNTSDVSYGPLSKSDPLTVFLIRD